MMFRCRVPRRDSSESQKTTESVAIHVRRAATGGSHTLIGRPPRADALGGGDGAINRFRRRGDADATDEVGGHDFSTTDEHRQTRMKSAKSENPIRGGMGGRCRS